jgi:hypothetical protein
LKTADAVIWRPKSIANNEKPALDGGSSSKSGTSRKSGAGEGARTLDPDLGKVRVTRFLVLSRGYRSLLVIDQ